MLTPKVSTASTCRVRIVSQGRCLQRDVSCESQLSVSPSINGSKLLPLIDVKSSGSDTLYTRAFVDGKFDRDEYHRRNIVEGFIGWLKESYRVATRYDKLTCSYLTFVLLAATRRIIQLLV